jgi:hypothetical protein
MRYRFVCVIACAVMILGAGHCGAAPVWATGSTLYEVIGYDLAAHDSGQQLTDYQLNAVCMLLGYFRGFAAASAVASHFDATSLPFVLPDSINNDQIERIVFKYLKDNPGRQVLTGDAIMVAALTEEYPNPSFMRVPGKLGGPVVSGTGK